MARGGSGDDIDIDVNVNDNTRPGLNSAERGMGKFKSGAEGISAAGAGAMGILGGAIVGTAGLMLDMGNQVELMDKKAKIVFGDQIGQVQQWSEANAQAFGLSVRGTTDLAAGMADLLKPMGFTTEQAAAMSTETLELSGALSAWTGGTKSAAEVSDILSAAFLGERDALQGLGISISAAEVEARLLQKGQQDLTGTALQQAEAIATQELIMEKSTDAQAAWAAGGRDAAIAQNEMSSTMAESGEKLATLLAPALEMAVALLAQLVKWASENQTTVLILAALTGGVLLLNAAMSANPISLVVLAIAGLVAGIVILINHFGGWHKVWGGLMGFFQDSARNAGNFVTGVFRGIGDFFGGLGASIHRTGSNMWNGIIAGAKGMANFVIGSLNNVIGGTNKLIYGFNVVSPWDLPYIPFIPRFAQGGVSAGGWALVGENGPEMVRLPGGSSVRSSGDGMIRTENGDYVPSSFYGGNAGKIQTEDGGWVDPSYYGIGQGKSSDTDGVAAVLAAARALGLNPTGKRTGGGGGPGMVQTENGDWVPASYYDKTSYGSSSSGGSGEAIRLIVDRGSDSAVADLIMHLIRVGKIRLERAA